MISIMIIGNIVNIFEMRASVHELPEHPSYLEKRHIPVYRSASDVYDQVVSCMYDT